MYNDTSNPWIQLFTKVNTDYNKGAAFDGNTVYGMSVGYLFVQALLAAGKNPTRESLLAAVQKGGFQGPGIVPLRFSASDHSGYSGGRMVKVTGGVAQYVGSAFQTDDETGPVNEYTGAAVMPPANGIPAA